MNKKYIPADTIPLQPVSGESFYAIVVARKGETREYRDLWIFRQESGTALLAFSKIYHKDDPETTYDGVRALDAMGRFDDVKDNLFDYH